MPVEINIDQPSRRRANPMAGDSPAKIELPEPKLKQNEDEQGDGEGQ